MIMQKSDQWMVNRARTHLIESSETKIQVIERCLGAIINAAMAIASTFRSQGKLMLCGNGGSAADCQHIAAEFLSTLTQDFRRPGLNAIALTTDTSFLTAFSNDYGFEGIFKRQVESLGAAGDLLIGFSTSGNSKNVIQAMEAAKGQQIRTLALTGERGKLADIADMVIAVPGSNTQYIQEAHIAIGHILCDLVERTLFEDQ